MCAHNTLYFEKAKFEILEKLLGECIYEAAMPLKKYKDDRKAHLVWSNWSHYSNVSLLCQIQEKRKVIRKGKATVR